MSAATTGSACPVHAAVPFPFEREHVLRPPARLGLVRDSGELHRITLWDGAEAWLVTRHDDARTVYLHPFAAADYRLPGFPAITPHLKWQPEFAEAGYAPLLSNVDDPDHARMRALIAAEFTVKRVRRLADQLGAVVEAALDRLEAGGRRAGDLAEPLHEIPAQMIMSMLGFPEDERAYWVDLTQRWMSVATSAEERPRLYQAMNDYIDHRLAVSETNRTDDFISRLLNGRDAGRVDEAEVRMLALMLYTAGFGSTANSMGLSMIELMRRPDAAAILRGEHADVPTAVEELLRYTTLVHMGVGRLAHGGSIQVRDQTIEDGEAIVISVLAANFDPAFLNGADELDLTRSARGHLGFGYGVHQCVGQQLARAQLGATLPRVVRRFPELRLAVPAEELTYLPNFTRVIPSIPVRW